MALEGAADRGGRKARWQAIDAARGAAVAAMIVYHLAWDLSFLQLIAVDVIGHPVWRAAARIIAGAFLMLAGVGLVLAHGQGFHGRAFLRRLAILGGAAAGVTLATWFAFPDSYIFFGILHCIALSSVLALPFLRAPAWLAGAAAVMCVTAPLALSGPAFDVPTLAFLGLGARLPVTNDYVPVFPWFGLALAGVALAQAMLPWAVRAGWPTWRAHNVMARALAWSGRRSLMIYLAHQPILFGALFLLAQAIGPEPTAESAPFREACQATCRAAGREPDLCGSACACMVERLKTEGLWRSAAAGRLTPGDQSRIAPLAQRCFDAVGTPLRNGGPDRAKASEPRP